MPKWLEFRRVLFRSHFNSGWKTQLPAQISGAVMQHRRFPSLLQNGAGVSGELDPVDYRKCDRHPVCLTWRKQPGSSSDAQFRGTPDWVRPLSRVAAVLLQKPVYPSFEAKCNADAVHGAAPFHAD